MSRMRKFTGSSQMLRQARSYLAGGVSSMMRAASKPQPLYFKSAAGTKVVDVDGNRYIDYTLAWGPLILGHSHPTILKAVRDQLRKFQLLGAQHSLEGAVARKICRLIPCAELVAFSNTGSEAVQLALRLSRAFTRRQKIIKFEGHYHGWMDNVLVSYHPKPPFPSDSQPAPATEGQETAALGNILVLPWNDLRALEKCLKDHRHEIAAIIMEPILCNSSCLMPVQGYLQGIRDLATQHGIVLIFDEVITGFRTASGGAQSLLGVVPDLATFGKAIAGGFPLSVVAGKREIMELIVQGRVVHAGTFNGAPISLAAADATLEVLSANRGAALRSTQNVGKTLMKGIQDSAEAAGIPVLLNGVGSAFHVSFTERTEMRTYRDTLDANAQLRDAFIEAMLQEGVYLLPDGRWYVSAVHTKSDVVFTLQAVRKALARIKAQGLIIPRSRLEAAAGQPQSLMNSSEVCLP
jgi:glutamate-1-semialdehyde 2,1-aminomutase